MSVFFPQTNDFVRDVFRDKDGFISLPFEIVAGGCVSKQSVRQNGNRKMFLYTRCLRIKLRFIFHVQKFGIKKETENGKVGDRQAKFNQKKATES